MPINKATRDKSKDRPVDKFARPDSMADYLKKLRKWKEGGMEGPQPKRPSTSKK